jgi:hypothetical protein
MHLEILRLDSDVPVCYYSLIESRGTGNGLRDLFFGAPLLARNVLSAFRLRGKPPSIPGRFVAKSLVRDRDSIGVSSPDHSRGGPGNR